MATSAKYNAAKAALKKALPGDTTVGFIGLGIMGSAMCKHLIQKGYRTRVYNRTLSKCSPLQELGATVCCGYADVGRGSDVVISIVGNHEDVKETYLGANGVFSTLREGGVAIDMTTSSPQLAQTLNEIALERGIFTLDAPVTGGDVGAREARLSIMVGGDKEVFEAMLPLLEVMGNNIVFMGPAGNGQHTKMANQIMFASTLVGVVEGILYAQRMGLDTEKAVRASSSGAAGSWILSTLGPRILKGDFVTGFYVEHFVKDLSLALEEARKHKIALPGLGLAQQLLVMVQTCGYDKKGVQALLLALEHMNNMQRKEVS